MALMKIALKDAVNQMDYEALDKLVEREIDSHNITNGNYLSQYEGMSFLLEEIEKLEEILKEAKKSYAEIWSSVKLSEYSQQLPSVSVLYLKGLRLSKQAVRLTAKTQKYYNYLEANNPQANVFEAEMNKEKKK